MAVGELVRQQQCIARIQSGWSTPRDGRSLGQSIRTFEPDLLHVHGLWSSPNRAAARYRSQLPLVIAPHGMLDPWAFSHHRRRKLLLWLLYEQRCMQRSAALQALCVSEVDSFRQLGLRAPIALIPNGVTLPTEGQSLESTGLPWAEGLHPDSSVLLFLSRFHHKKGLQPLLQAWQSVCSDAERTGWSLALVGYGDSGALHRQVAAAQAQGELPRLYVCPPVFGSQKEAVLRAASAFVLPSFSEGLPMAALEAMAFRLPCLLSRACNLPEAFSTGAAIEAEPDPAAIAASLRRLFALSSAERMAMGAAGRNLVCQHFSWSRVAEQTLDLYRWILGGGPRPSCVVLS